jgi:hypothetical protein
VINFFQMFSLLVEWVDDLVVMNFYQLSRLLVDECMNLW